MTDSLTGWERKYAGFYHTDTAQVATYYVNRKHPGLMIIQHGNTWFVISLTRVLSWNRRFSHAAWFAEHQTDQKGC